MEKKAKVNAIIACNSYEREKYGVSFQEAKRQAFNLAVARKETITISVCDFYKKGTLERYSITPKGVVTNLDTGEKSNYERMNDKAPWA